MIKIKSYNLKHCLKKTLRLRVVKVLTTKEIRKQIIVYVIEDETYPIKYVEFKVFCTGSNIEDNIEEYNYLSSIWIDELAFHVFYKILENEQKDLM